MEAFPSDNRTESVEGYYSMGKEHLLKGDLEKANECFKKADALFDKEAHIRIGKGSEIEREKDVFFPPLSESVLSRAWEAFGQNNLDKSLELYLLVQRDFLENSDIYYNIGIIYLKKEKYTSAAIAFKNVIQLDPSDADSCYNLGVIYENFLRDNEEAAKYYSKYLDLRPNGEDAVSVKSWIEYISKQ